MRAAPCHLLALLASSAWLAYPPAVAAHRLDEYLQATLVSIDPLEVRLRVTLTPGVAVAEEVLAQIDRDRDQAISTGESIAYVEMLQRDIVVQMDRHTVPMQLVASSFPKPEELRSGWAMIELEFSGLPGPLASGPHRLTVENRHLPSVSVYLINALQPKSSAIRISGQHRNDNQSKSEIDFDFEAPSRPARSAGFMPAGAALLLVLSAGLSLLVWRTRRANGVA